MKSLKTGKPVTDRPVLGTRPPNKGIHWEYRVFGVLSTEHRAHVKSVCSTPLDSGTVTDRYLWNPDWAANIKIRGKKLKFKHLLGTTPDGFELWEEGGHLEFEFPLNDSAIELLEKDLRVAAPAGFKSECKNADALASGISLLKPGLKCITIDKYRTRWFFLCEGEPIRLEIAELPSPAGTTSIAVESAVREGTDGGERLSHMRGARDVLGLPGSLEIMGYMQFLEHLAKRDPGGPLDPDRL